MEYPGLKEGTKRDNGHQPYCQAQHESVAARKRASMVMRWTYSSRLIALGELLSGRQIEEDVCLDEGLAARVEDGHVSVCRTLSDQSTFKQRR